VESYLPDPSTELSSLEAYPNIRQVYLKLNTGLPASAAVERLFSISGRVFSPLRSRLSSEHFEMMLFLRTAAKWWNFCYSCGCWPMTIHTETLTVTDTWPLNDRSTYVCFKVNC